MNIPPPLPGRMQLHDPDYGLTIVRASRLARSQYGLNNSKESL
jgi:hypothetical protein